MANLHLHLKGEYFKQIASGEKQVEYRLATPGWEARLAQRTYKEIFLYLGYPKAGTEEKTLSFPWLGVFRRTIIHPHFGRDPVEVFAIPLTREAREGLLASQDQPNGTR